MTETNRRNFLIAGGTGIAVLPFASRLMAQPAGLDLPNRAIGRPWPTGYTLPEPTKQPGGDRINIAVMGLGSFALNQMIPAITRSSRCRLAGLVSGNTDKATAVAATYGVPQDAVYSYDTFDQIASDDRIDAVYVVLPNGLHADWTVKAFEAGKHVLSEKAMATSSRDAERMIEAGKAAGRKLMLAYRIHFEPNNLAVMKLIEEGHIGRVRTMQATKHYQIPMTRVNDAWRVNKALAGGGALVDYGIYGLNAAFYLSGEAPSKVYATVSSDANDPRFTQIEDRVAAHITFPSGAVMHLTTSYGSATANEITVFGEDGNIHMNPATYYGGIRATIDKGGRRSIDAGDSSEQFVGELDHFAQAIQEGTPIKTGGEMGLRDIRLIEAIYTSIANGKAIDLNPDMTMKG